MFSGMIGTLVILFATALISCGPTESYEGSYVVEGGAGVPEMLVELREDGTGVWKRGYERVSFNWGTKGEQLRLHFKDGGVVVGNRKNGGFEAILPGTGKLTFRPGGK
jgi:hypothetical protein